MIPVIKTSLKGDNAARYIHFAQGQLAILDRQQALGFKDERRVVSPFPGVVVECLSKMGKKEIRIQVAPTGSKDGQSQDKDALKPANKKITQRRRKVPLIAGGWIYISLADQKVKRSLCYYDKAGAEDGDTETSAFSYCTPIEDDTTYAQHTFFQVRYTYVPVEFIDTSTTSDMVFTLSIAKGYILNTPLPATIVNILKVVVTEKDYIKKYEEEITEDQYGNDPHLVIHDFEERIDQEGLVNGTSFSANFNADKTKLYVVFYENPDVLPEVPTSTTSIRIYARAIINGKITWELEAEEAYTFAYHMNYAYVDNTGTVWGLYKGTYEYATFDIITGALSAATTHTAGYSIADGDFAGIFIVNNNTAPSDIPMSGQNNFGADGACTPLTYVDDGALVDWGDSPCAPEPYPIGQCYPNLCVLADCSRIRYDEYRLTSWYSWSSYSSSTGTMRETATIGENVISSSTGYEITKDYSGEVVSTLIRMLSCSACTNGYQCIISIEIGWISNLWTTKSTTEDVTVIGGTISKYKDGYELNYDRVFADAHEYTPTLCSYSAYLVANNCSVAGPEVRTDYDAQMDIAYPFPVSMAQAVSSFIAWDNNVNGLVIKGMRYITQADSIEEIIVEIDGFDVKEDLFAGTGFDISTFSYLGFLF